MPLEVPISEQPGFVPFRLGEPLPTEIIERLTTILDIAGFQEMYWEAIKKKLAEQDAA